VFAEDEAEILARAARTPDQLEYMVAQRVSGQPLERIVGWAEFCGLRIWVDPGVFVPRRRSEFLVDTAVELAAASDDVVIVDLCCGTGALGVATAAQLPSARLYAADLDPAAVACARRNVESGSLYVYPGGHVFEGDLFTPLPAGVWGQVSILTCNAPYVPTEEIAFMPPEACDHEARMALDGGADGLAILRRVASQAPPWLAPGGTLLVETSERQAALMAEAMTSAGLVAQVHHDDEMGATVVTGTKRYE
jgi:release factor glutamine methyltransferase